MSDGSRSFWASIPGLITGIAGLLTGVVGLVTLGVQQGIIGDDDSPGTTVTAPPPAGATATTDVGAITVSPPLVKLASAQRDASVTVRNSARTATVTVLKPQVVGAESAVFSTDAGCTNVRLEPGASCTFKVLFAPSGLLKPYRATLAVRADGVAGVTEVPVEAGALF